MIIFIHGADTFRSRRKLRELKEKYIREVDQAGSSLETIAGETLTLDRINQAAGSASLFSRRRLVVVERLAQTKNKKLFDELVKFFKPAADGGKRNEDNIIIFWEEGLEAAMLKNKFYQWLKTLPKSHVYEFKPLSNTELAAWIKKEAEARGAKIAPPAAAELAGYIGNNLWQIDNEINKLIGYKTGLMIAGQKEIMIEADDVKALVRGNFAANIFALTDAIGSRAQPLAFELLERELEAGIAETQLLFMIVRQFRLLLAVKQAVAAGDSPGQITRRLKLHPYVAQKCFSQTGRFTLPVLKKIFQTLVEIDYKIKTGQADLKTSLNLLMAKI